MESATTASDRIRPDRVRTGRGGPDRRVAAERHAIGPAANVLSVLSLFNGLERVTLRDAAGVVGVSQSTAFRLLATLEAAGLAERVAGGGYQVGAEALRWASNVIAHLDLRYLAGPILLRLTEQTGLPSSLALLREGGLIVVETITPDGIMPGIDQAVPMHASAHGKAVAVHLPRERLRALLGPEPWERMGPDTATTWSMLEPRLERTLADGYGMQVEETAPDSACLAVAIRSGSQVVGSLSISSSPAHLRTLLPAWLPRLRHAAHLVSRFAAGA